MSLVSKSLPKPALPVDPKTAAIPPPCSASRTGDHDCVSSEESSQRRVSGVQTSRQRVVPRQARGPRCRRQCHAPAPARCRQPGAPCRGTAWSIPRDDPCTRHRGSNAEASVRCARAPRTPPKPGPSLGESGSAPPPKRYRQYDAWSRGLPRNLTSLCPSSAVARLARPRLRLLTPVPAETSSDALPHRGAVDRLRTRRRPYSAWTKRQLTPASLLHRCLSTGAHRDVPHRVWPCRQRAQPLRLPGRDLDRRTVDADRLQGVSPPTSP